MMTKESRKEEVYFLVDVIVGRFLFNKQLGGNDDGDDDNDEWET